MQLLRTYVAILFFQISADRKQNEENVQSSKTSSKRKKFLGTHFANIRKNKTFHSKWRESVFFQYSYSHVRASPMVTPHNLLITSENSRKCFWRIKYLVIIIYLVDLTEIDPQLNFEDFLWWTAGWFWGYILWKDPKSLEDLTYGANNSENKFVTSRR